MSVLVEFVLEHLSTLFTGDLSWLHVNLNVIPQVTFLAACCLSTHLARSQMMMMMMMMVEVVVKMVVMLVVVMMIGDDVVFAHILQDHKW